MSGSQDKAVRRDLRRAMGAGAVTAIDEALGNQTAGLSRTNARIDALSTKLQALSSEHRTNLSYLLQRLSEVDASSSLHTAVLRRTLIGRLTWVVTGR